MSLEIGRPIPSLSGATEWIDRDVEELSSQRSAKIVQFWAISCPICKVNMPRLQEFLETYQAQGLQLISVHMPRMEADMNVEKVKAAIEELGIAGPCAIDNEHTLGDRFQTGGVWPCYFLFDAEGKLRSRAAGALGIKMAENSLRRLLELEPTP